MIRAVFFVVFVPLAAGILSLFCFGKKPRKVGALLFHRISEGCALSLSQVSVRQFEDFCEILKASGKKTVPFSKFSMKEDEVCICFDDGHESVFHRAFPMLKNYGFTATVFAASAIIKGEKIEDFYDTKQMMNAQNLLELSRNGWEIASHGARHLDLTLLTRKDLRNELIASKNDLENLTKKSVSALSFPYGSWNEKVLNAAKKCGYKKFAVYRNHGKCGKTENENEIIPATAVYPFDSKTDVRDKINGKICGGAKILSTLVPHFAKGTPMFFWNYRYGLFR